MSIAPTVGVRYPDGRTTLYELSASGARVGEYDPFGAPDLAGAHQVPPHGDGTTRALQYGYDASENLKSITDAITGAQADVVVDSAGRVKVLGMPNGTAQTFTWDSAGRMIETSNGTRRAKYQYDYRNQRIRSDSWTEQRIEGDTPQTLISDRRTTTYMWGASDLVAETSGAGTIGYTYAAGMAIGAGDQRLLHDALGSVVARVSSSSAQSLT